MIFKIDVDGYNPLLGQERLNREDRVDAHGSNVQIRL